MWPHSSIHKGNEKLQYWESSVTIIFHLLEPSTALSSVRFFLFQSNLHQGDKEWEMGFAYKWLAIIFQTSQRKAWDTGSPVYRFNVSLGLATLMTHFTTQISYFYAYALTLSQFISLISKCVHVLICLNKFHLLNPTYLRALRVTRAHQKQQHQQQQQ